ncbi:MAG: hypothetical protein Q9162_004162 [Coniocarpon cinnabarinum]
MCDSASSQAHYIKCFKQEYRRSGQLSPPDVTTEEQTLEVGSTDDPVVSIEPVAIAASSSRSAVHHLIVIQKSGRVRSLVGDREAHNWDSALIHDGTRLEEAQTTGKLNVRASFAGNGSQFWKLLTNLQPHLFSQPGSSQAESVRNIDQIYLVGFVTGGSNPPGDETQKDRLQIYAICPPENAPNKRVKVEEITSARLPSALSSAEQESSQYRFDAKRGQLLRLNSNAISVWDVVRTQQPSLFFEHCFQEEAVNSCAMISKSSCFIATAKRCLVMDTRFHSVQAQLRVRPENMQDLSRKRKRSEMAFGAAPVASLHCFAKPSLVVGISNNHIALFDLSSSAVEITKRRPRTSRLADALGRVDESGKRHQNKASDRLLHLLAKTFDVIEERLTSQKQSRHRLSIGKVSHEEFSALVKGGYITPEWIQQALRTRSGDSHMRPAIEVEDIVQALSRYDPTLMLISELIFECPTIGLPMLICALNELLHSFEPRQSRSDTRLLTDVTNLVNGDLEHALQIEEDDAAREIDLASELLENGASVRTSAIQTSFEKLATCFHPGQVSQSLKRIMSPQGLVSMIDILRLELRRGGWISHAFEPDQDEHADDEQSYAISAICRLLCCAVDALGAGALLQNTVMAERGGLESFAASLRQEASTVLEGVQESSFFDGFLRDFLHYERVMNDSTRSDFSAKRRKNAETSAQYLGNLVEPAALPIGTKSVERISSTRVAQGGEVKKRSARDISQQMRGRLGPYTFERLRF